MCLLLIKLMAPSQLHPVQESTGRFGMLQVTKVLVQKSTVFKLASSTVFKLASSTMFKLASSTMFKLASSTIFKPVNRQNCTYLTCVLYCTN